MIHLFRFIILAIYNKMIKAFEKTVYCLFQFEFEEIQFSEFYIPMKNDHYKIQY